MKKILIIGGAGYVGTVLTSHLLAKGYKVNTLDNLIYENHFSVQSFLGEQNYKFFKGEMGNDEMLKLASKGVTDVIILAGLVGDPITKKYPNESKLINEIAVQNCFHFFNGKGLDKLIFVSTCSNYGLIKENELADENFELNPLSLYSKAKVKAEKLLVSMKGETDFSGVVLRFATAFGLSSRMRFDLSVSEFVKEIYFGNELLVYDEHTWRPYCHVRDFAKLMEMVLNTEKSKVDFEIFNAGGDVNNFTKKMIVDEILKNLPDGKIAYGNNGSDPRNYKVSFDKVKTILGFEPSFTVKDGIKELIGALKDGFYNDILSVPNKYGNYVLNQNQEFIHHV